MKQVLFTAILLIALGATAGCGIVDSVTGSNSDLKRTNVLWSDVPRMDGLNGSDMDLPLPIKVVAQPIINKIIGDETHTGDWVVFDTAKTPQDVLNFYTNQRMSENGWEESKASTCLSGSEQGIPQVGTICIFEKLTGDKRIGLLIIAGGDDQTKQTDVFFVRVEGPADAAANNAPTVAPSKPPTKGAITMLNGTAPYEIEKRPMPSGLDLDALLPKQVGPYTRASVEQSSNQGTQATGVEVGGDSIYAHYRSGGTEIFVEFAVSESAADAQATLDTAAGETTGTFPTDPRLGSMGTEPSDLKVNNEYGEFFAWTRGGYYYSASAKGGEAALDAFMQAFPF